MLLGCKLISLTCNATIVNGVGSSSRARISSSRGVSGSFSRMPSNVNLACSSMLIIFSWAALWGLKLCSANPKLSACRLWKPNSAFGCSPYDVADSTGMLSSMKCKTYGPHVFRIDMVLIFLKGGTYRLTYNLIYKLTKASMQRCIKDALFSNIGSKRQRMQAHSTISSALGDNKSNNYLSTDTPAFYWRRKEEVRSWGRAQHSQEGYRSYI